MIDWGSARGEEGAILMATSSASMSAVIRLHAKLWKRMSLTCSAVRKT
ncbi:hypothetical protein [Jidongwangia harbinensis]|nr:hypothetical protein [Jidongwangia harbinensis]MCA2214105.1 hypothetical protein [Jidongwangia harbinensis]